MVDKLRIDQFKGLYTNANEASLNPEYQREAFNVRFKAGSIESEGYTRLPLNYGSDIVYVAPVRLDEDRYGSKLVDEEIVVDYTQNFRYYLIVQKTNFSISLQSGQITFPVNGETDSKIVKVIESDGVIRILCESGKLYHLRRIDRYFKEGIGSIKEDFYLREAIDLNPYLSVSAITTDQDDQAEKEVYFKYVRTEVIQINGVNYWRHLFEEYDEVGLIIQPEIWFLAPTGTTPPPPRLGTYMWVSLNFLANYTPINMSWSQIRQPSLDDPANNRYGIRTGNFIAATFRTLKPIKVADYGFDKKDFEILMTTVYDETNEYVTLRRKGSTAFSKYFIKIEASLVADFNKRVTGFNFYLRFDKKDDFELVKSYSLILGKASEEIDGVFTSLMPSGVFLSQTIGTVYDDGVSYKPVISFDDFLELGGITYGIYQGKVYFCSVGKGNIMKEVFYDYIPEAEGKFLVDVNGSLGVFSGQLDLIAVQDSGEGYLLFSFKDSLNFDIRDQYDLAYSPEGIIIHTNKGIYVTNGYERQIISEQINDIVEKNYDTGNIFYDDTNDVLFYLCGEGSWRYDFAYPQWAQFIIKNGEDYDHLRGILSFGYDGEMYQNVDSKVYQLQKTNDVTSIIQTPRVDLDFPNIAKIVTYFIFDFEGRLILSVEDQLEGQVKYDVTHTERRSAMIGVPVGMRVPSATLGSAFTFSGKIFAIEIHYDILGEFRDEDFIPSPEAYFQGPSQLTELLKSIKQKAKTGS